MLMAGGGGWRGLGGQVFMFYRNLQQMTKKAKLVSPLFFSDILGKLDAGQLGMLACKSFVDTYTVFCWSMLACQVLRRTVCAVCNMHAYTSMELW